MANCGAGWDGRRPGRVGVRRSGGRVVSALFFFPRGGSAQVARALCRVLPTIGWEVSLAAGSLGGAGGLGHAASFFSGVDVVSVDYSPARRLDDPTAAIVPFQPSYEDRPGALDRVFAAVDDGVYERLVAAWGEALASAGAASADVLHLHHLTPANEAALRALPAVPVVGQLHGTELALLRAIEAGPPAGWGFAGRWAARQRRWAQACQRLIVPPGAAVEVGRLLGVPLERVQALPSGVELELFQRRALGRRERLLHWRRWLVEEPLGWDESGTPGTVAYREADLWPFREAEAILLYVGRYTAVKRLPLLIEAHARALQRLRRPLPLVLVGGHPGEWEGQHPLAAARELGNEQVFLAGWRRHGLLPQALNAADLLVLPSVAEAFGLVLVEAMACGLPVIAAQTPGPTEIVAAGTGWLIPPDDEEALADALVTAASDAEERQRRGARAYHHSHTHYGWPLIAARIAALYTELAASPHTARA
jgi:glycosyltransferase involved in cell wall biosynthesis